jgi:hypothetical protein
MRKFSIVTFVFVFSLALTSVPANANSTVRVGDSCKTTGSKTTTDQGFTLACIKSGSKLVWGRSVVASADALLELFMNTPGTDCDVILQSRSKGIGSNGLPERGVTDLVSICSPASEIYEVRFDNSDRIGKRSQTYFYVDTGIMHNPRFAREGIEKSCSRGEGRGPSVDLWTPDVLFLVFSSDGFDTPWVTQAVMVIQDSFGGVGPCDFLKAIPDFGKTVYRTAEQSAAAKNSKAIPTPKPTATKPMPAKTGKAAQGATLCTPSDQSRLRNVYASMEASNSRAEALRSKLDRLNYLISQDGKDGSMQLPPSEYPDLLAGYPVLGNSRQVPKVAYQAILQGALIGENKNYQSALAAANLAYSKASDTCKKVVGKP